MFNTMMMMMMMICQEKPEYLRFLQYVQSYWVLIKSGVFKLLNLLASHFKRPTAQYGARIKFPVHSAKPLTRITGFNSFSQTHLYKNKKKKKGGGGKKAKQEPTRFYQNSHNQ